MLSFLPYAYKKWAATWKTQQNECAPSEDSDQPGHPPSLIRVFAVRMKKRWVFSYPLSAQRRLWSDWADAQADPSLRWAHSHIVGFVMRLHINKNDTVKKSEKQYCYWWVSPIRNEQPCDKTNKLTCAPSEDSDQPGHMPIEGTAKTLIRLGGCPGWSKPSLCGHSFCWFCHEAARISITP